MRREPGHVRLRTNRGYLAVGGGLPVRTAVAIGANSPREVEREIEKLRGLLSRANRRPDIVVDLSTVPVAPRLYERVSEVFDGPIGLLPHYLHFDPISRRLDGDCVVAEIERASQSGVTHITLHLSAGLEMLAEARATRVLPSTSRGGALVLANLESTGRDVLGERIETIVDILRRREMALSLGSTFRPAWCGEALDRVHQRELLAQDELGARLLGEGIQVMREGIGHASIADLGRFAELLRRSLPLPLVALGPTPVDHAGRLDPVAAACGITALAGLPQFAIAQTVTRDEHGGGVPNLESAAEALEIAQVAIDAVNLDRGYGGRTRSVAMHRMHSQSCVGDVSGKTGTVVRRSVRAGCSRCVHECPLTQLGGAIADDPLTTALPYLLPAEVVGVARDLIDNLRALGGTVLLFGSTARGTFSYARCSDGIRLQSDIELNVVKAAPSREDREAALRACYSAMENFPDQPLFDVDVRVRAAETLADDLEYDSAILRELYCYSLIAGKELSGVVASEIEVSRIDPLVLASLQSALEWYVLRVTHLGRLVIPLEDRQWWQQAILASLVCKLAPAYTTLAGLPFTATCADEISLRRVPETWSQTYADALEAARADRSEQTGEAIANADRGWTQIESLINPVLNHSRVRDLADAEKVRNLISACEGLLEQPDSVDGVMALLSSDRRDQASAAVFEMKCRWHLHGKSGGGYGEF